MRVHINFEVIEKNGNDYLNFSKELNDIITNLKERQKNIKANWVSTNGDIFNTMFENYINDMQVDNNRMERYGNILLGINDDFKQTDLEYAKNNSVYDMESDLYDNR